MVRLCLLAVLLSVRMYGADASSVAEGKQQFTSTCSFCHGPDATGGAEGPNLMRSALVRHDANGNLIGAVIRSGRPAKGMPAFPLTDQQIASVVAYLHARVVDSDRRSPARPKGYALSLLLTGDVQRGKAFFSRQCSACHSASGDLAGVARKYEPADLQARFLYPPDMPVTVDVVEHDGKRYSGTLLRRDWFTIALRDAEGQYRSWRTQDVKVTVHDRLEKHLELLDTYSEKDVHDVFAYLETFK